MHIPWGCCGPKCFAILEGRPKSLRWACSACRALHHEQPGSALLLSPQVLRGALGSVVLQSSGPGASSPRGGMLTGVEAPIQASPHSALLWDLQEASLHLWAWLGKTRIPIWGQRREWNPQVGVRPHLQ